MYFPHDGKSSLSSSTDATMTQLQKAHLQVEDLLLGMVQPAGDLTLIARFDGDLKGHLGQTGTGVGAIRYWSGRFNGSKGVLIEQDGENVLPNPSAEVDLTGWSANDPAVALSRDTGVAYTDNGTVSVASFKIAGTGDAGPGYVKSTIAVEDMSYAASVYVYSAQAAKAKLELAFTGGTPVSYATSETSIPAGTWTRLELSDKEPDDNTSCEIRIYLVQEAPSFQDGSRLSYRTPSSSDTALVTDTAMTISLGDVVMCAVTANPAGPEEYAFHMVTAGSTGATGVADTVIRLDGESAYPTFVPGSRFSKWVPAGGDAVQASDNAMTITAGDLVFCRLEDTNLYDWHIVTTGATGVSSAALRLDGSPIAPEFDGDSSRFTRFVPTATALVTDAAMTITAGDLVYCYPLANPAADGYGWHLVTTGATGVSGSALRLDGQSAAPTFAAGSRFSKLSPTGTALESDGSESLTAGDLAFCYPTANPSESGYGWHMITTGATGVSSSSLRLDQCSSGTIYADCIQLEESGVSSYIDSFQGTGFSGSVSGSSSRAGSEVSFPASGNLGASAGTIAFWFYPLWAGNDGSFHVLFDAAVSKSRNRLLILKDVENKLVFAIYDGDGEINQVVSSSAVSFSAKTWQHLAVTYADETLKIYHNGYQVSTSPSGDGDGAFGTLPSTFRLGTDYTGDGIGGAIFDDLVIKSAAAEPGEIAQIGVGSRPYSGVALVQSSAAVGAGRSTTDSTPGTQSAVAHGLGAAPSMVFITERGNGIVYVSAAADDDNFYVKGSAADLDFDWRAIL